MSYRKAINIIQEALKSNTKELSLAWLELERLPLEIAELSNIETLDLIGNKLTELPREIGELKKLTHIYLHENNLAKLPPEIGELKNLFALSIHDNNLAELPVEIGKLTQLRYLDLSSNKLSILPKEIGQLKNLTKLYLYQNELSQLPISIGQLENLSLLNLRTNLLSELPLEIGNLQKLEFLDLSSNKLTQLPEDIANLNKLECLDLDDNKLSLLPTKFGQFKNLVVLKINNNGLTHLPIEIGNLKTLQSIQLVGNNLKSPPPEILIQGTPSILAYLQTQYKSIKAGKTTERNEAKLILLGEGETGKTTLAEKLMFDTFDPTSRTEGIDIQKWHIQAPEKEHNDIELNVWDFGGQEIYKATHQFFLTKRSVYLLVWNARDSLYKKHIYKWLHIIETFGEDSPVIMVMTKKNEHNENLNMADLKKQFANIKDLYKIDCAEANSGEKELRKAIQNIAWNLPHMRTVWIYEYQQVRKKLESLANNGTNWIECEHYKEICKQENLDEKNTEILDQYLHDLGVTIHFRKKAFLKNMLILNPEWATKAVYKVLDTQSINANEGILHHEETETIWDTQIYPPLIHNNLLELMNAFELAYRLPDGERFLVAEHLPATDPEDFIWDYTDNMQFIYTYSFLPNGVMTRFIVRSHENLKMKSNGLPLCWKEGAVLEFEDTSAFVRLNERYDKVEIYIKGNHAKDLLAIIRNQFHSINKTFSKITISEKIPCSTPGCNCLFKFEDLVRKESKGRTTIECMECDNEISITELLNGYTPELSRGEIEQKIKVYNNCHIYNDNATHNEHKNTISIETIKTGMSDPTLIKKLTENNEEAKLILSEINEKILVNAFFKDNEKTNPAELAELIELIIDDTLNKQSFGRRLLELPYEILKGAAGSEFALFVLMLGSELFYRISS